MELLAARRVGFVVPLSDALARPSREPRRHPNSACVCSQTRPSATLVHVAGGRGVAAATAQAIESLGGGVVWSQDSGHQRGSPTKPSNDGPAHAAVFAVGAGDAAGEMERWASAVDAYNALGGQPCGLFVARSIVVPPLLQLLAGSTRWVVARPGALVADEGADGAGPRTAESRLLLTDDIRVNGIISREMVGLALAKVALAQVPVEPMLGKVVGIYDTKRIISLPKGVRNYFA